MVYSLRAVSFGQVSHQSGFYNTDSLFWEYNYNAKPGDTVFIAVNRFTDDAFVPYTKGVWLYNRNYTPNTWENAQFSKSPFSNLNIDTTACRGKLRKVNVVRIKVNKQAPEDADEEHVYFIGINAKTDTFLHSTPVVHIYVDSLDAFGSEGFYGPGKGLETPLVPPHTLPGFVWNYNISLNDNGVSKIIDRSRIEKECFLTILNDDDTIYSDKKVGIRISGNSSADLYNKGLQVIARNSYSKGKINTSLLGAYGQYSGLRLRAGGSGQQGMAGFNELGMLIIANLDLGKVDTRRVAVYLNGSYWSMSFAQEKSDDKWAAKILNVSNDSIDIIEPLSMRVFGTNPLLHLAEFIDTAKVGFVYGPPWGDREQMYSAFYVRHGKKQKFEAIAQKLQALMYDSNYAASYTQLDTLIEVNSMMRFLSVVDFLQLNDNIANNVVWMMAPNRKPHIVMRDFDGMRMHGARNDYWHTIVEGQPNNSTFLENVLRYIVFRNPYCIQQLLRVEQDMLNTTFQPMHLQELIDSVFTEGFMKDVETSYLSWGGTPNGGKNAKHYEEAKMAFSSYLHHRYHAAWQIMADHWMPENKYKLKDRRVVMFNFDSIPAGLAKVELNTLTIDSNWHGLYLPKPSVKVKLIAKGKLPAGYILEWKEYPGKGLKLELFANTNIVLTPVLRQSKLIPAKILPNSPLGSN